MTSRAAVAPPVPVPVSPVADSPDHLGSPDRRRTMPAVVPPRTSSTRRAQPTDRPVDSPRRTNQDSSRDTNGRIDPSDPSRSRRTYQDPYSPNGRGNTSAAAYSRSPPADTHFGNGPSRDASEILNNFLDSQHEARSEKERMALIQAHQQAPLYDDDAAPPPIVSHADHGEEPRRGARSRHDHSKKEKPTRFGEYILGNTIGEGEFGKVKLGWKADTGHQVAIKLIKKDQLGNNPARMAKIMREVAILKQLTHPNIVKLHKMEESERHYGIVLEYASGGELFDYILNHRYLKDNAARRLFAQLISGVGYLHKKGIVHRDLKLENLLLDRNRNIIITDFGFANTFDPNDELTEEEEMNLSDKEFVKRMGLDKIKPNGMRRGDLMQTSCGSPCYAAPELVVSDSLYTGRKVDVWSCGVILYAMLAGYLPFDDDPANPEGDNINLLYKYIVNTPLTFPDYVTPHARDLLRRILVPNPRKRADLFEVARHSWLSEYAHVVEFITSSTTTPKDIQNTTVPPEDFDETPTIARSASVRESSKKAPVTSSIGGLATKQGTVDVDSDAAYTRQQRDNKRRTVQVEYVAPSTNTQRGESSGAQPFSSRTGSRSASQSTAPAPTRDPTREKPTPSQPVKEDFSKSTSTRVPQSSQQRAGGSVVAVRTTQPARSAPEPAPAPASLLQNLSHTPADGPPTSSSISSNNANKRASYSQPAAPELNDANVEGRIEQPPKTSNYGIPSPTPHSQSDHPRPGLSSVPPKFIQLSGFNNREGETPTPGSVGTTQGSSEVKGHKRSNTMSEISGKLFGRSGSIFGGKNRKKEQSGEKTKKYPPISMNNSMPGGDEHSRTSLDSRRSRRSFSIGIGKKTSGSITSSQEKKGRRFSFLPYLSKGGKEERSQSQLDSQQDLPIQEPPTPSQSGQLVDQNIGREHAEATTLDNMYTQLHDPRYSPSPYDRRQSYQPSSSYGRPSASDTLMPPPLLNTSDASFDSTNLRRPAGTGSAPQLPYPSGLQPPQQQSQPLQQPRPNQSDNDVRTPTVGTPTSSKRGVLQKPKRFTDAYDAHHDHSGSSGPARRVMDFFRRRAKARAGDL